MFQGWTTCSRAVALRGLITEAAHGSLQQLAAAAAHGSHASASEQGCFRLLCRAYCSQNGHQMRGISGLGGLTGPLHGGARSRRTAAVLLRQARPYSRHLYAQPRGSGRGWAGSDPDGSKTIWALVAVNAGVFMLWRTRPQLCRRASVYAPP